jgi:hypothetical protein
MHINFCRLPHLLVFSSLLQILKFLTLSILVCLAFGAPCPKKKQKILLRPCFGAFLTLGPRVVWIPH